MFSRNPNRWLALLAVIAASVLAIALAHPRFSSHFESRRAGSGFVAGTPVANASDEPIVIHRECTGNWLIVEGDEFLPNGVALEICEDGYVGQVSAASERDVSTLVGSRYVVGDVDATDITRPLWRSIDFEMPKPDGSITELSVSRPLWWIEETGAKVGETIDLGMHEIGIAGEAKVLKIGPCDVDSREMEKGKQIVTGTIKHHNAEVWDLVFNNEGENALGVTGNHPIYSDDRDDWIPAGELNIGENVRTLHGTAKLTGKSQRPGRHTVYNVEVHRSHAYHVTQFGILAHNSNILDCTQTPIFRGDGKMAG